VNISEWLIELYGGDHATHAQHKIVDEFLVEQAFIAPKDVQEDV